MIETILKRFDSPDEVRTFEKGRFEIVRLGGQTIGRATYEPGWRWSEHVGPAAGLALCPVEHVGLVLEGVATAEFADGRVVRLEPGTIFHIPPVPHDSRVIGDERYVSLHFLGGDSYAAAKTSAAARASESARNALGFEPYRPRRVQFHGLREVEGYRLKHYSIAYRPDEPIRHDDFERGFALAFDALPRPARSSVRPGVGFMIAHQGRGADYAVLAWWDRENELPIRVSIRESGGAWRAARGGESVCVWDLDLIRTERDAYVATVLARGGDTDAYLALGDGTRHRFPADR